MCSFGQESKVVIRYKVSFSITVKLKSNEFNKNYIRPIGINSNEVCKTYTETSKILQKDIKEYV